MVLLFGLDLTTYYSLVTGSVGEVVLIIGRINGPYTRSSGNWSDGIDWGVD